MDFTWFFEDWEDLVSLAIYALISFLITFLTLNYFTKKNPLSIFTYITTFGTYYICFFCVVLLPIDVASGMFDSAHHTDERTAYKYMYILWEFVYWAIQILGWIFIPICQSYVERGEFSMIRKLIASILENIIVYALIGVVGVLVGIVVVVWISLHNALNVSAIVGLCLSLSNAYGLILLSFFFGYGMAKFPKFLWNAGNNERNLQFLEFKTARLYDEVDQQQEQLERYLLQIKALDKKLDKKSPLRKYVKILMKEYAKDIEKLGNRKSDAGDLVIEQCTRKTLEKINCKLRRAKRKQVRYKSEWKNLKNRAFFLEDVIDSTAGSDYVVHSPFRAMNTRIKLLKPFFMLEWFYLTKLKVWLFRIISLILFLFSLVLIWCQMTPLIKQTTHNTINVSVLYWVTRLFTWNRVLLQVVCLIILGFMAACTYYAMFSLKFFDFYRITPYVSGAPELLFTGVFLCRVIPALCFNFMNIIGVTKEQGVAFFVVMGTMRLEELKLIGKIGGWFSDFFPMIIVIIFLLTLFNVYDRVVGCFGFERFVFSEKISSETVEEGREILQRERKKELAKMKGTTALDETSPGTLSSKDFSLKENVMEDNDENESQKRPGFLRRILQKLPFFKKNQNGEKLSEKSSRNSTSSPNFENNGNSENNNSNSRNSGNENFNLEDLNPADFDEISIEDFSSGAVVRTLPSSKNKGTARY